MANQAQHNNEKTISQNIITATAATTTATATIVTSAYVETATVMDDAAVTQPTIAITINAENLENSATDSIVGAAELKQDISHNLIKDENKGDGDDDDGSSEEYDDDFQKKYRDANSDGKTDDKSIIMGKFGLIICIIMICGYFYWFFYI